MSRARLRELVRTAPAASDPRRAARRAFYLLLVRAVNALQHLFIRREGLYRVLFLDALSGPRWRVGVWRAWVAFERAYRTVPAYRRFVDERGGPPRLRQREGLPDLSVVPETDKDSYVRRYPHTDRCVGGEIPAYGVVVDESSGSSGSPTSWLRGPEERWTTKHTLQMAYRNALGDRSFFVINAFALGAWATGLNVTLALNDVSIMKSTGPNLDKIVQTMREFGPGYEYVVMGYPPFLKSLADHPELAREDYRVRAVFGGEGISESLREYLLGRFTEVLGSYGASDLEINMGAETPFAMRLRRAMRDHPALRERLTDSRHGVLPMVFQYNPLAYHLETNAAGELLATLSRPTNLAPKIRYNIRDLGHVARFEDLATAVREEGHAHLLDDSPPLRLPFLFLYGRSDMSIDYYGANVTPGSVREVLFALPELAPMLEGFKLLSVEDAQHDKTMEVALELADGAEPDRLDRDRLAEEVFTRLAAVNRDFHNAWRNTATPQGAPRLTVHARRTGPFAGGERIKKEYVARRMRYDEL